MVKRILLIALAALTLWDAGAEEKIDYIPKIHGVFRGRYEGAWPDYEQRFQVRNARVSIEGNALNNLTYYFRFDISDRGKMKFLDGYANWKAGHGFAVRGGQFRVPFGVDCFRGPGTYIFANRSFLVKNMANVRQVGVQVGYTLPDFPLTIQAGVFNSKPKEDHEVWQNAMDFAAKGMLTIGNVTVSPSFLSMKPYLTRTNHTDISVAWIWDRWFIEGEYQHMHYVGDYFDDVEGWTAFAAYNLPVDFGKLNTWDFHARFDGITDFSDGKTLTDNSEDDTNGTGQPQLTMTTPATRRVTVGTSLFLEHKPVKVQLLLDYEHYFYNSGVVAPAGCQNRLVAELILKF